MNQLFCCHLLVIFIFIVPLLDDTVTKVQQLTAQDLIMVVRQGRPKRQQLLISSTHTLFLWLHFWEADHGTIGSSFTHDLLLWSSWLSTAGLFSRIRIRSSGSIPADCGASRSGHGRLQCTQRVPSLQDTCASFSTVLFPAILRRGISLFSASLILPILTRCHKSETHSLD